MSRLWVLFLTLVASSVCGGASRAEDVVLAKDGATSYVIVVPSEAMEVEKTAASELQGYLKEATGADFEVLSEDEVADTTPRILVGRCEASAFRLEQLGIDELGDDGIVIEKVGHELVLAGKGPRGTLYAVYSFLEDVVGVRWWTSAEEYVPKHETLAIGELRTVFAPKLTYREAYYRDAFDGRFAARCRLNGSHHRIAPEYGGRQTFAGFVHTFYPLIPPEKYFDEHPEWYSEIDGKRQWERCQLCLTNGEMRAELVKNALARLRSTPDAKFISISQNDWHGRCQCEACMAIEEKEGSPAGPLLHFVNKVAAEIEREFPDVFVETLAYQYTRKPPKHVRPRDNVVIRLCSIECSFVQPLAEGEHNTAFREDIEGWHAIAPRLFIWDYVTNFSNYMVPHPNLRVLGPNVRYFVDNGVIGIFEQGDAQCGVGDFVRMRAWVIAHLLWDPTRDADVLIDEFLEGYYGPAAPHLKAYLDLIQDRGEQSEVYFRCFMPDTSGWLRLEDLNEATRLFDKALAAVKDDPVLHDRVRRERLVLDHVWLRRYYALQRSAKLRGVEFLGPKAPRAACDEFIALCERWNVGNWRERVPFKEYGESLSERFGEPGDVPDECEGLSPRQWIDLQEFDMSMARAGEWASLVDDENASNDRAIRMPGTHREWAVQARLTDDFESPDDAHWRCIAYLRCEAEAKDGQAMTVGIYDYRERKGVAHAAVNVDDREDGYIAVELGTHVLKPGMTFWAAPPRRPGEVTAVYVDRFVLIRAEAE